MQTVHDAIANNVRSSQIRIRQNNRKLFATKTRGNILAPHGFAQNCRNLTQHIIPMAMAEAVVELLKIIDVDHEQRQGAALPARMQDFSLKAGIEGAPIP